MKKYLSLALVCAVCVTGATAVQAAGLVHNTAPAAGWNFGTGNNYSPANTSVLTDGSGQQAYLRLHETFQAAPASAGGVYSFALGTSPISFDWGFSSMMRANTALITLKNIGSGAVFSYNPLGLGNDNFVAGNNTQNSFRFNWVPGGFFTPNTNSTYKVNLTANGQSLDVFAKLGTGAVPEPAMWAMMIFGFGAIGTSMRGSRNRLQAVAA